MHHLEPIKFSDDKVFEYFICDYLSAKLGVDFTTFGRNGQKQDGIDGLHYKPDDDQSYNVVQCKNYNDTNLKYDEIVEHLESAHKSNLKINHFYFVTASNKDVKLQRKLQENHVTLTEKYGFSIDLLYYSDIFREVITSYHTIAKKYFAFYVGNIASDGDAVIKKKRDLYHLYNIAYNTDTSFINMPYYIELFRSSFNYPYSSFSEAIKTILELVTDGSVFYDAKLNEYISMFIDYDCMIDNLLITNYSNEFSLRSNRYYYEYIGVERERHEIEAHLSRRVENYSYTFKRFLAYLKENYLEFDITKCYYIDPFKGAGKNPM
ncbi:restriction endonuclease [Klebsiella quasipneumoniae]|uniref:restriction endonuclease n=2 Tax=Klebsiella quasipneumoniae TaxID=1463165 RepID=UPI002A2105B8|nr:restriction endonuclease [Klebsiella quasipneumoniae subsp. similipneumoniae]HEK5025278.1 restriction endonuclease [Klebsiella quasipneumoniae]HEK7618473.1 restriction endonuclease [Klebsiella quasipneumoniae]HEK7859860.1 restriction endonuclease [Klebsiella quasipneumoniae]